MDKRFFKITIPNYNNMAYIRQCLDSLVQQTFKDWFCVIVDDQSTDMSYEFAKMYERRYPNMFKVIRSETKRYAGGCRNIGIEYPVECEYFYFMDSDDYLYTKDSLKIMHDAVIKDRPDMLLFNWCSDCGGRVIEHSFRQFDINADNLAQTAFNASWTRVIKASRIKSFLEQCMRAEDTYQMLTILDETPTIKQIQDRLYVYRRNPAGAVLSGIFKEHRPVYIKALKELRNKCKNEYVRRSIDRRLGLK